MLDRLHQRRLRASTIHLAQVAKGTAGRDQQRVADTHDRYGRGKLPFGASVEEMPRTNLPNGSRTLGAFLGSHPAITASTAVVLGAVSLAGVAQGATLEAQLPDAQAQRNAASDRSIVFVGMNDGSRYEVQGLVNQLGSPSAVTYIKNAPKPDVVKIGNVEYDLSTETGRADFAAKLGLKGDRADALTAVLEGTNDNARDELGQLAKVFAEAEQGGRYIERLVLSGHSVGSMVWGDGNGSLSFSSIGKLAAVFPRAAGQVQDLALIACYTGGETTMDQYRAMFPNVKTIWAYDGSAPGSVSGAVPHLLRWERGTRGPSVDKLVRDAAAHTRKGENVAVWTESKGYDNGQAPADITQVRAQYDGTKGVEADFVSGKSAVDNPSEGPLREHYNNIQRLLGRRDLPANERAELQAERDLVIRLLYYKNVSGLFQTTYKSTIDAGFQAAGMQAPDFSKMTRAQALEVIGQFDGAVGDAQGASRTVKYLQEILHGGIRDLKPAYIPEAWM